MENRADAPSLFLDELEETLRYILTVSAAGVGWPTQRRPNLRRILMSRTKNHVYFVVDDAAETVRVHAIWGAPKGRTPKL